MNRIKASVPIVDQSRWRTIINREFLVAADEASRTTYFQTDFPTFDMWFETWIDATGLWSGSLEYEHDRPLVLVATAPYGVQMVRHEWNEAVWEYMVSSKERHPSLTAAERNR